MKHILITLLFIFICYISVESSEFDLNKYESFLENTKDLDYKGLKEMYPSDPFNNSDSISLDSVNYYQLSNNKLNYTEDEIGLLEENAFLVTERHRYPTFIHGIYEIWKKDLPLYLSNDFFLNILHLSFKNIFKKLERYNQGDLRNALTIMLNEIDNYEDSTNINSDEFNNLINDAKLYISVAKKLNLPQEEFNFDSSIENEANHLLSLINDEKLAEISLFAETKRFYDFSLFKPRGFYADNQNLSNYFKAIMWLGHINIYISNPENNLVFELTDAELDRQTRLASFLSNIIENSEAKNHLEVINNRLIALVGRQDNINYNEVNTIIEGQNFEFEDLMESNNISKIRTELLQLKSAKQSYNSSFLISGKTIKKAEPGSVFKLLGQRPLIDGFITSRVVYDEIIHNEEKVKRMLPNSLDVLFGLGNNAVLSGLESELNQYNYSPNLASVRYLIDSYDNSFWERNVYTNWLAAIRSLNPTISEEGREQQRSYKKTAAWQQKTASTQLASWAELRHDYILHGKQPTSDVNICEFPDVYLEPSPEFFQHLINIFQIIENDDSFENRFPMGKIINVFDTLKTISVKIHGNITLEDNDRLFLKRILFDCSDWDCDPGQDVFTGWISELVYGMYFSKKYFIEKYKDPQMTVADIHTSPSDEGGNIVGWVKHIATGAVNLSSVVTENEEGKKTIYSGPVYSFFDFTTSDFYRLNDDEWVEKYSEELGNSFDNIQKPIVSQCYTTDSEGKRYNYEPIFETKEKLVSSVLNNSNNYDAVKIFPQPAKDYVNISLNIVNPLCKVEIMTMSGKIIQTNKYQFGGTGTHIININLNNNYTQGAYLYKITNGDDVYTGKLIIQ